MFLIHLPHLAAFLTHLPYLSVLWKALLFLLPLQLDPMSTIMALMNQLGGFFNSQNQQNMQNQVYGQQQNALSFLQDPQKFNQFSTALQSPYAFGNVATPGTAGQANQYMQGFQDPYSNVANAQTAAQNQAYLQGNQTPYSQMLGRQDPSQMNSLINQYTQGLNSGLTAGVWNTVQDQLAQSGMTQAPGMAAYNYSQALAPFYQQNIGLGAQLAQAPISYGLAEQNYGLSAGQLPLSWQQGQQQFGLQAGQVPLNYNLNQAGMGISQANEALKYPLSIGGGLAGSFPNYEFASGMA